MSRHDGGETETRVCTGCSVVDETETRVALDFQSWVRPRRGLHLISVTGERPRRGSCFYFLSWARPRGGSCFIFCRGRDRDEVLVLFFVVGETETRACTYLGDGCEIEGPNRDWF